MPGIKVLNPEDGAPALPALAPADLSQEILREARAITAPEQCGRLDGLTRQLRGVDPATIEPDAARIAFWANLYNALLLHCLCLRPVRGSMLRHLRLFAKIAYDVDEHRYTLNDIEHGVLRRNRRAPFHLRRPLQHHDPRLTATLSCLDPRVHFALNCGARSCPPIQVYSTAELDGQLELATRSYLQQETKVDLERRQITLPRLMRLYAADFGNRAEQLRFAARYLPEVAARVREHRAELRVSYGRFDWTATTGSSA